MWSQSLSDLQFHLASLFPLKEDIIRIAASAGLDPGHLTISDKGITFWYHVLTESRKEGKLDEVILEARRLYPNDEKLSSFNAILIDKDKEVSLIAIKELCADIIREGQYSEALPLVEQLISRSTAGDELEENIVVKFADLHRLHQEAEREDGNTKKRYLKFTEASKSELISLIHAL
jgi:hypothetical protein